jgi:CRP-like cAMP-binding protein
VGRAPGTERVNLLWAALPEAERRRLEPYLETVRLELRESMIEPGEPIRYVYFPLDLVASIVHTMSDGATVETGIVGYEGLVGVQVWLRQKATTTRTFVQVPGQALRMRSEVFLSEVVRRNPLFDDLLADYMHAYLSITTVTAACNRIHRVEPRLCRWLKMVHNRVGGDSFPVRHEFLAYMLGVHRPSISIAANLLKKAGLIRYDYGRLSVLDTGGLEAAACECYATMETQMEAMYGRRFRK